jgi:hypothetical protein
MKTYILNILVLILLFGCKEDNPRKKTNTCLETTTAYLIDFKIKGLRMCSDSVPNIVDTSFSFNTNSGFFITYNDQYDFYIDYKTYNYKTPLADYTLVVEQYLIKDKFSDEQNLISEQIQVYTKGEPSSIGPTTSFTVGPEDGLNITLEYEYKLNPLKYPYLKSAQECNVIEFDTSIKIHQARIINFHNSKSKHKIFKINKSIKCNSNNITELFEKDNITYGISTFAHIHQTENNKYIILNHVISTKKKSDNWDIKKTFYNESTPYIYSDPYGYTIEFWLKNKDSLFWARLDHTVPNFKNYP